MRQKHAFFDVYTPRARTGRDRTNSFGSIAAFKQRLDTWLAVLRSDCQVRIRNLDQLTGKHAKLAVHAMEKAGYSASTLQNTYTLMTRFLQWQARGPLPPLRSLLQDPQRGCRQYSRTNEQSLASAQVDIERVRSDAAALGFAAEGLLLKFACEFGLRPLELVHCQPLKNDMGGKLFVFDGSKGGKPRFVDIDTPSQRHVLEEAKELARPHPDGFVTSAPRSYNAEQRLRRLRHACERVGFTMKGMGAVPYSCRREFALGLYERAGGVAAPVRGGDQLPIDRAVLTRRAVSEALGHNRASVFSAYGGSVPYIHRDRRKRLLGWQERFGAVRGLLEQAGFRCLRLVGREAEGWAPNGLLTIAWEGVPEALADAKAVSAIRSAAGVPVVFTPMRSPGLAELPSFEVM